MSGKPRGSLIALGLKAEKSVAVDGVSAAVQHALFWMMAANAVGLWLAWLLLVPSTGNLLGELTYGRWAPVHLNLHLYGWTSLPLVAWLLTVYGVAGRKLARPALTAIWAWSMALGVGAATWLGGNTSGKIFLDWTALARVLLPLALLYLWGVLALGWWCKRRDRTGVLVAKALGLLMLAVVPVLLYWASGREVYPAVNPETGGPTGVDLLGSTLTVVLLLLLLPIVQRRLKWGNQSILPTLCWAVFAGQILLVAVMGMHHASHRDWRQWLSLASLSIWIVLIPRYYRGFVWPSSSRRWLAATLIWFGILTATGWLSFLPTVLDHLKFTDGLVAHSHLAMAGFVTSFNFLLISLLGNSSLADCINRPLAFWSWNGATAAYVILMWVAGAFEGGNPAFTIVPGIARSVLYTGRLLAGAVLLGVSIYWWRSVSSQPAMQE